MSRTQWTSFLCAGLLVAGGGTMAWSAAQQSGQGSSQDKGSSGSGAQQQSDDSSDNKLKPRSPGKSAPKRLPRAEDDAGEPEWGPRFNNTEDLFQEMERMMQQLDRGWPQLNGVFDGRPFEFRFFDNDLFGQMDAMPYGPGSHISVQQTDDKGTRKLDLEVKQDGSVTAEVMRDGQSQKIEAGSFDEFRANHGEILKEFGVGGGPRPLLQAPDQSRSPGGRLRPTPSLEPRGKKLGVQVTPVSEDLAAYLDLEPGVGLMVREVVDNTLASRMGLKRGDIIVEVAGESATGTEVIARALKKDEASSLEIVVIRKGARVTLHGAS